MGNKYFTQEFILKIYGISNNQQAERPGYPRRRVSASGAGRDIRAFLPASVFQIQDCKMHKLSAFFITNFTTPLDSTIQMPPSLLQQ